MRSPSRAANYSVQSRRCRRGPPPLRKIRAARWRTNDRQTAAPRQGRRRTTGAPRRSRATSPERPAAHRATASTQRRDHPTIGRWRLNANRRQGIWHHAPKGQQDSVPRHRSYTRPPTSRRFAWTPECVAALQSLWGEGLRPAAIGQRWGVSGSVIAAKARHLRLPPHQATWTDDRVEMLRRLQSQGLHGDEIAQQLSVPFYAVISKMRRLKLLLRKITWTDDRIAMLRLLQGQGLQAAEIAQRLGLSQGRIYGATYRLGLSFRARRAEIKAGLVAQVKTPKPDVGPSA